LNVSLRSVSICIVDDNGDIRHEAKVAAEVDQVVACLRTFSQDISAVGFEAGALAQYFTYGLQAK
jgi:transposase